VRIAAVQVTGGNNAAVDRLDGLPGTTTRNPGATSGAAVELSEC